MEIKFLPVAGDVQFANFILLLFEFLPGKAPVLPAAIHEISSEPLDAGIACPGSAEIHQVPGNKLAAIENRFTYLIPKQGRGTEGQLAENWALSISLVWYLGQSSKCAQISPFRPLFGVADKLELARLLASVGRTDPAPWEQRTVREWVNATVARPASVTR